MNAPLPALTPAQQGQVQAACATLRLAARDRFLLDLASELARSPTPLTDLDLRMAMRKLLGVVPVVREAVP
jgi:hypothetical protein